MSFDFSSNDVLLDIDAICTKLCISRSTLERLRRPRQSSAQYVSLGRRGNDDFAGAPEFPEPTVVLGTRNPRWSSTVLNEWIKGAQAPNFFDRKAARQPDEESPI